MKAYTKTFLKFSEIFTGRYEYLGHMFKNSDNVPFSFGDNDYTLIAWKRFKTIVQDVIDDHDFGHEILGRGFIQNQWEEIVVKIEIFAAINNVEPLIDLEG
jgi:hypothetical protein